MILIILYHVTLESPLIFTKSPVGEKGRAQIQLSFVQFISSLFNYHCFIGMYISTYIYIYNFIYIYIPSRTKPIMPAIHQPLDQAPDSFWWHVVPNCLQRGNLVPALQQFETSPACSKIHMLLDWFILIGNGTGNRKQDPCKESDQRCPQMLGLPVSVV